MNFSTISLSSSFNSLITKLLRFIHIIVYSLSAAAEPLIRFLGSSVHPYVLSMSFTAAMDNHKPSIDSLFTSCHIRIVFNRQCKYTANFSSNQKFTSNHAIFSTCLRSCL